MLRRPLRSAAVASSLLAANLVVLTLYLNPDLTLRGEARALFLCLFLPYLLLGMAALLVLALIQTLFRFWTRPAPLVPGWWWLGSFLLVETAATAAAYTYNLLSYRHSIPVDSLRALAASTAGTAIALLFLLPIPTAALPFP